MYRRTRSRIWNEAATFTMLNNRVSANIFWDCLISDIESLILYAGIHPKRLGLYKMCARRFPYLIYYEIFENTAYVVAVLPTRREPRWVAKRLQERR